VFHEYSGKPISGKKKIWKVEGEGWKFEAFHECWEYVDKKKKLWNVEGSKGGRREEGGSIGGLKVGREKGKGEGREGLTSF
jgi:hypothetical protein